LADGRALLNTRGSAISRSDFDARRHVSGVLSFKAASGIFLKRFNELSAIQLAIQSGRAAGRREEARSYLNRAEGIHSGDTLVASRCVTSFSSRYNAMTGTERHSSCSPYS